MSYAWRTVTLAGGTTAITRWEGKRIWGFLDTTTPTSVQLADALGRAMWAWTQHRAGQASR